MDKKEWTKQVKSYLADFDKAEDEDWFEWIQEANELLAEALELINKK